MIRLLLLVWCLGFSVRLAPAAERPNILLILCDDLGWSDLGCYGSEWQNTPELDRLAESGVRFTQGYAAQPICSANRAALLTGRAPARLNLTDFIPGRPVLPSQKWIRPQITLNLPLEEATIAEHLRPAGYISALFGKWHVGGTGYGPLEQGFAHYDSGMENTVPSGTEGGKGEYDLTAKAIAWMQQQPPEQPFFCFVSHNTPHIPLAAKPEEEARWSRASNPTYAAMMATLDDCTGMLLKALEEQGRADNTLVIFLSDNGGLSTMEGIRTPATSNAPLRGGKGSLYEGGTRVPWIMRWPGKLPAGKIEKTPVIATDLVPTLRAVAGLPPVPDGDGKDLSGLLLRREPLRREALHWHYPHYSNQRGFPAGSIRQGDWKLIESYDDGHFELYLLRDDPSESLNLAASQPLMLRRLQTSLQEWRTSVNARPMQGLNPEYDPEATWNLAKPDARGQIRLPASHAEIIGTVLRYEPAPAKNTLGFWTRPEDQAAWDIMLPAPGKYRVTVHQGCGPGNGGSVVHVRIGKVSLPFTVIETGGWQDFRPVAAGEAELPSGRIRLTLAPQTKAAAAVMDVRMVTLEPVD